MKKITNVCLFLLLVTNSILDAQTFVIKTRVFDEETNKSLPYANIMVFGYSIGTTSDEKGEFVLILNDSLLNEFLIISYLGYESQKVSISECLDKSISLIPINYELAQVTVEANIKKHKTITLNKFRKNECMLRYSISPFDNSGLLHIPYRPSEPTIEAIYFPSKEDYSSLKIKEVSIYAKNLKNSISYFRLRIFNADENKTPINDLFIESLIFEVLPGEHIINANLEGYNLSIPPNVLYIGFELLIIPENKKIICNELGNEAIVYSPFLYQIRTKEYGDFWIYTNGKWLISQFWYFKQGIWFKSDKPDFADKDTAGPFLFKPAISLILSNE